MRLIRLGFQSAKGFLAHYSDALSDGLIYCRTKMDLEEYEPLISEIVFPELGGPVLIRAEVYALKGEGAWLRFLDTDSHTRDYVVGVAQGGHDQDVAAKRHHQRFPTTVPAWCTVGRDGWELGRTHDVGAGGAFIRSTQPPPVGTEVTVEIGRGDERLKLAGEVAWVKSDGPEQGFGVRFDRDEEDTKRLRKALRRARETGRFDEVLG